MRAKWFNEPDVSKNHVFTTVVFRIYLFLTQNLFLLFVALTKVCEKANSVVSYEVQCPNWLHKYIIGRKGTTIQKLTNDLSKVS